MDRPNTRRKEKIYKKINFDLHETNLNLKNMKFFFSIILFFITILFSEEQSKEFSFDIHHFNKQHISYLISAHQIDEAISKYLQHYQEVKVHDFNILQQIASTLLEIGSKSKDVESETLTIFGISLIGSNSSLSNNFLHFLKSSMKSQFQIVQMSALHLLNQIYEDDVDNIISIGLNSDYLQVRFEALYKLISRKSKNALGHVESLCNLLPYQLKPFFIELYPLYGSYDAILKLKQMCNDKDVNVRLMAILYAGSYKRDDMLTNVRAAITHVDPILKEAASFSLGALKDLHSIEQLKIASESQFVQTKLAALLALHKLGDEKAKEKIREIAKDGNVFAISICGDLTDCDEMLKSHLTSCCPFTKLNAAIALLKLRNPAAKKVILEALTTNTTLVGFYPSMSVGKTLMVWKTISSALCNSKEEAKNLQAISNDFQENILQKCIDLPEETFIEIANEIFKNRQNSLIPKLVMLLENVGSDKIKQLLKEKTNEMGSPLIRSYCLLALYRLGEGSNYKETFLKLISNKKLMQLIEFKPTIERGSRQDKNTSNYQLSPEENSGFFIEAMNSMANKHDIDCVEIILKTMKDGNVKNRFALAGLLLKSIQ